MMTAVCFRRGTAGGPGGPPALLPDLREHVGAQEALDDHHEQDRGHEEDERRDRGDLVVAAHGGRIEQERQGRDLRHADEEGAGELDRKSTRLNSSHANISYAVFCLKKKKKQDKSTY